MSAWIDEADFVIVGTGAGGATAARVLTGAGHSALLVEEGEAIAPDQRPTALIEAMARTFRDFGTTVTAGGRPFPLLQGRLVGGSTAINSGIIWRMPEDTRVAWGAEHGLAALVEAAPLERAFEEIERELQVAPTAEALFGGNNERMAVGARALGLPGKAMLRNAARCRGSGRCLQGCPNLARQSMDVSYVPRALQRGGRLHAQVRVERVLFEGRRAVGVEGVRPSGERVKLRGRRGVIVAGGAIQTPLLLWRSGVRRNVGQNFRAHPGSAVVGRFDAPIAMSFGATQAYEIPLRERGMKLETLALPPEMLASRLPGAGAEWQERLSQLDHYAQWAVLNRMEAVGTIRPGFFAGTAKVVYTPTPADLERTREGVLLLAKLLFAAGATEVYPGFAGRAEVVRSVDELAPLAEGKVRPGDFHLMASHLFGGACAGSDPRRAVVDPTLAVFEREALYCMDASVFPSNLGVNPQHTIMGMARRAAEQLANESEGPRAVGA